MPQGFEGVVSANRRLMCDGKDVHLELWDADGHEHVRRRLHVHYRKAAAIVLVFDLTNLRSFLRLDRWLSHISEERGDVTICLIGAKADLKENRQVSQVEAVSFATTRGFQYFEISSKENVGIEAALESLVGCLLRRISS